MKPEEVGFFDPEYEGTRPIVNAGKHVFYKDIYVFIDRLKDITVQHRESNIRNVLTACFRETTLMWYSTELTDLKRILLRATDLNK